MERRKIRGHEHVREVILHGPLTEMCIAICQPASDHFLSTLPGCLLRSVCTVTQSWRWSVWRTESSYPFQHTLSFRKLSSPTQVYILTLTFEK